MLRDVTIKKVNGGFILTVGCQTFVEKTEKEMFKKLTEYWKDPEKTEKKYVEEGMNKNVYISRRNPEFDSLGSLGMTLAGASMGNME